MKGRDIICLSTQYWAERRFRKQEFMSRFAQHNRVLFVEPSFSMVRRPEEYVGGAATNWLGVARLRNADGVHVLTPPRGLPFWSRPSIEKRTYRWFARSIQRAAKRLGFRDVVLWVYAPAYAEALDVIEHRHLVFDLVDDLAAYGGDEAAETSHVQDAVEGIVARSDLLVVSASTLLETYGATAKSAVQVSNGYDDAVFGVDATPADGLAGLRRPVIGFVGTIFKFLDFELLRAVARRNPDKSLVLVGPLEAVVRDELERLVELPNVTHVGPRPKREVPSWIAGFDVCLNPFLRSRVADSVNPLKVYEYLASGKPVVSTPMEALQREPAGHQVEFAEGPDAFCTAIDRALASTPASADARRRAAAPYAWDALFEKLDAACDRALRR